MFPRPQQFDRPGTAARCACHGNEVMAVLRPDNRTVEVRDRRHGTAHVLILNLPSLIRTLDPLGTTATLVGSIR